MLNAVLELKIVFKFTELSLLYSGRRLCCCWCILRLFGLLLQTVFLGLLTWLRSLKEFAVL